MKKGFLFVAATAVLAGCASPQDKGISAYCRDQAFSRFPINLQTQQVERYVLVGEKTIGIKTKCETVKNDSKTTTKIETQCINEPIKEGIYENRLVREHIDVNYSRREDHLKICIAQARSIGMFKELNK